MTNFNKFFKKNLLSRPLKPVIGFYLFVIIVCVAKFADFLITHSETYNRMSKDKMFLSALEPFFPGYVEVALN